ncbi:MAG TPA: carbonic anhydrase [Verrucomicrobiota bacterium]|nr:carbonic anhydrase [Verrucomicrobiota bacterium]
MRLFETIIEANHRAAAGDSSAGLRPSEHADSLPVAALSCIDARLNPLLPEVLGIPEEQFIWLRNAGNIITGPLSSTMRSLALACAVKGAKEIVIIGHTDCQVCKTTTLQLIEKLKNLGIERHLLPDNVNEYFGMFSSERQNVIKAAEIVRSSPLIGPKIPVHGVLIDIQTGRLEWLVNGYQEWATMGSRWNDVVTSAGETVDKLKSLADFQIGEMKFPETKIGETVSQSADWLSQKIESLKVQPPAPPAVPTAEITSTSSASSIAEQIVRVAEQHWPKLQQQPPPTPTASAKKIPLPPPLKPKPISRSNKR